MKVGSLVKYRPLYRASGPGIVLVVGAYRARVHWLHCEVQESQRQWLFVKDLVVLS
jgi:hypothetical protein